jgi:hypothetical protein
MRETLAVIGFKAHTGWATHVVVSGEPPIMEVFARGRTELLPADGSIPRFVYHEAAQLSEARGADLVSRAQSAARKSAVESVSAVLSGVRSRGVVVKTCALVAGSSRMRPGAALPAILQSHPLIHAAEGSLFRDAVDAACRECGLALVIVAESDVWAAAARAYDCAESDIRQRVAALRGIVGPPWGADEKIATAAALAAGRTQSLI